MGPLRDPCLNFVCKPIAIPNIVVVWLEDHMDWNLKEKNKYGRNIKIILS